MLRKRSFPLVLLLMVVLSQVIDGTIHVEPHQAEEDTSPDDQLGLLDGIIKHMRQQELYMYEKTRSEGHSGLKQVRHVKAGTRPYYASHHSDRTVAAIHNHANNIRTVGLGEFVTVLNGVEFRTRHNDYSLVMPSTTSTQFHEVEEIPFPDVPNQVTNKETFEEQVVEMQAWFKAWADQDHSQRDYRDFFKPVLCYLEGAWVHNYVPMDGFNSDRHHIEAEGYIDLFEQNEFTASSGRKNSDENLAYLPSKLVQLANGTTTLAQWNYRILCHPLKQDLKFNRMRPVDDLVNRIAYSQTFHEYVKSNGARFQFNQDDEDEFVDTFGTRGYLDTLMEQIPGKDNYPANLIDDSMEMVACEFEEEEGDELVPINAGYYHRWFKIAKNDASGSSTAARGYSDENLFVALTSNEEVVPSKWRKCEGSGNNEVCTWEEQRWTYAIPLEVVYLTPLSNWNPRDFEYKGDAASDYGQTVTADGRTGALEPDKAYNGTNSKTYYITPPEFYTDDGEDKEDADTTKHSAGVLDREGVMWEMRATGMRVFLPNIPGVGALRQRWPVMPVHGEGSAVWKELEALKDIVLHPTKYGFLGHDTDLSYEHRGLSLLLQEGDVGHTHVVHLKPEDVLRLQAGEYVWIDTEPTLGHEHRLKLFYKITDSGAGTYRAQDMKPYEKHDRELIILTEEPDSVGHQEL